MCKANFPSTVWSNLVVSIESRHNAQEFLVSRYWKPIFYFILRWNGREDAADLTQEFLTRCLEKDFLDKLTTQETKGSFRRYLKTALSHFLLNRHKWQNAQKRVGDFSHLPFREAMVVHLPHNKSPEELFNHMWAKELMQRCYELLRIQLNEKGKDIQFAIFHQVCVHGCSYQEVIQKYNIDRDKVKNAVARAKKRLEKIVNRELSESVSNTQELADELAELKKILRGG